MTPRGSTAVKGGDEAKDSRESKDSKGDVKESKEGKESKVAAGTVVISLAKQGETETE